MPPGGQRTIGRHVVILLCAACTGVHQRTPQADLQTEHFASALPARGASNGFSESIVMLSLCLGAACTGCIHSLWGCTRIRNFASALPARGASSVPALATSDFLLCLGAACTGCIAGWAVAGSGTSELCLGAACTGCILCIRAQIFLRNALPRRCLHGVHPSRCLRRSVCRSTLPRRCLHGVHL